MLLVPQTAAANWRVFCSLVCMLFSLMYFSLVFFLTLLPSSGVFVIFCYFPGSLFEVFTTSPARGGGGARQFVSAFILSSLFLFSLRLFHFVSLLHRMRMSFLSYIIIVGGHGIALPTAVLTAYVAT